MRLGGEVVLLVLVLLRMGSSHHVVGLIVLGVILGVKCPRFLIRLRPGARLLLLLLQRFCVIPGVVVFEFGGSVARQSPEPRHDEGDCKWLMHYEGQYDLGERTAARNLRFVGGWR